MSYCEHCDGQRFDRSRVLRVLRRIRRQLRAEGRVECSAALGRALAEVKALDIPHLELLDDDGEIVH